MSFLLRFTITLVFFIPAIPIILFRGIWRAAINRNEALRQWLADL